MYYYILHHTTLHPILPYVLHYILLWVCISLSHYYILHIIYFVLYFLISVFMLLNNWFSSCSLVPLSPVRTGRSVGCFAEHRRLSGDGLLQLQDGKEACCYSFYPAYNINDTYIYKLTLKADLSLLVLFCLCVAGEHYWKAHTSFVSWGEDDYSSKKNCQTDCPTGR